MNGHWGLRLALGSMDQDEQPEVVYGPHISSLLNAYGPRVSLKQRKLSPTPQWLINNVQDLFELPVNRTGPEKTTCASQCQATIVRTLLTRPAREVVKVKHQFTFSALSPGRVHMLDTVAVAAPVKANATEAERVEAHDSWEHLSESEP